MAVVVGVLASTLFSCVVAAEDCAAGLPLHEMNRSDNVVKIVKNIALRELIIPVSSIVPV